jgi:Putative zinc-finger
MEDEILRKSLAPSAECLSIEQLGRYADGALGPPDRAAADSHIRQCLNCQAELALLQTLTSTSIRIREAKVDRFRVLRMAAMAAVLLVAIAAGSFYLLVSRTAPELPRRVTSGDEVTRSLAITARGPVGDQVEAPRRFEWLGVDRAARYRVRLMEVDRHEIWSTSSTALEADLPSSVRSSITPGRTLLWDVTAYDAAGAAIAESGLQSFRVAPRGS